MTFFYRISFNAYNQSTLKVLAFDASDMNNITPEILSNAGNIVDDLLKNNKKDDPTVLACAQLIGQSLDGRKSIKLINIHDFHCTGESIVESDCVNLGSLGQMQAHYTDSFITVEDSDDQYAQNIALLSKLQTSGSSMAKTASIFSEASNTTSFEAAYALDSIALHSTPYVNIGDNGIVASGSVLEPIRSPDINAYIYVQKTQGHSLTEHHASSIVPLGDKKNLPHTVGLPIVAYEIGSLISEQSVYDSLKHIASISSLVSQVDFTDLRSFFTKSVSYLADVYYYLLVSIHNNISNKNKLGNWLSLVYAFHPFVWVVTTLHILSDAIKYRHVNIITIYGFIENLSPEDIKAGIQHHNLKVYTKTEYMAAHEFLKSNHVNYLKLLLTNSEAQETFISLTQQLPRHDFMCRLIHAMGKTKATMDKCLKDHELLLDRLNTMFLTVACT